MSELSAIYSYVHQCLMLISRLNSYMCRLGCQPHVAYGVLAAYLRRLPVLKGKHVNPNRASFPPASESTPPVMHGRHPACTRWWYGVKTCLIELSWNRYG